VVSLAVSAESEPQTKSTSIVIVPADRAPKRSAEARALADAARKKRARERAEHVERWAAIEEAGGARAYVERELTQKGLLVRVDPATLSDADKAGFKDRKRAEAAEKKRLGKLAWEAYRATHVVHVGAGIFYSDTNDETAAVRDARLARAKESGLGHLDSPEALAKALGVSMPELRWLCFHREVEGQSHYNFWTIPKRDGTTRAITAPKAELKRAQRWLLHNVIEKLPVHHAAHGFLQARTIATNAAAHAGADVVVKLDLRDFFPTITFRRVKGLLRAAGLAENVATLAALLATEPPRDLVEFRDKTLYVATGPRACPQGAPTSPAITNAICGRLDRRMSGLARTMGLSYTRYADDLTFSYRRAEGADGAAPAGSRAPCPVGALLRGVKAILKAEGFGLHDKKTAVMRAGMSQRVTGLVVNAPRAEGVPPARVPREVVRRLKAAIKNRENGKPGKGEPLAVLKGMAAYVHMTDEKRGRAFLDRIAALERGAPA
jgi:RNA-directed DNA polymerase